MCWLFKKLGLYRTGLGLVSFSLNAFGVRDAGLFLITLAMAERERGYLTKAEMRQREAVQIWEQAFGPNSLEMAAYLNFLLRLLQERGDHQDALSYCRRALEIVEQCVGPAHNDTAVALNNLGLSLVCVARSGHAEDLIEPEQHLLRAVQVNPITQYPHYWLAKLYQKQGRTNGEDKEGAEWERYLELGPTNEKRRAEALTRLSELATP